MAKSTILINVSGELERYTAANSNFQPTRHYISMSNAIADENELARMVFEDTHLGRLKCYKGYQMEKDLVDRLRKAFPTLVGPYHEISAFDGMVLGHPDFSFGGSPADCKTVPLDEHLPVDRVPKRVYWQMQAYMLFSNWHNSLVVYESRESGRIKHFWLMPNVSIQAAIKAKYQRVVDQIRLKASS